MVKRKGRKRKVATKITFTGFKCNNDGITVDTSQIIQIWRRKSELKGVNLKEIKQGDIIEFPENGGIRKIA